MRSGWGGQSTGSAAGGHSSFSGHGGASSRHTHHGGYGSGGPGSANKPRHSTARSRNTTTGPAGRFADKPPIAGLFEVWALAHATCPNTVSQTDLQTSAPDYPGAPGNNEMDRSKFSDRTTAPGARHGAGGQLGSPFGAAASPMSKTPLRQPSRPQFPASPAGNTMTPVRVCLLCMSPVLSYYDRTRHQLWANQITVLQYLALRQMNHLLSCRSLNSTVLLCAASTNPMPTGCT